MSNWEQFVYSQKIIYGDRKYKSEILGSTLASAAGRVRFQALAEFNTRTTLKSAVEAVGGNSEPLGINNVTPDYSYYLHGNKYGVKISNTMVHPVAIKMYTLVLKKDWVEDATVSTLHRLAVSQIYDALVQRTAAGSSATTYKLGDTVLAHTAGTTTIDTYGKGIDLREAKRFGEWFKVADSAAFVLQPGDFLEWDVDCPNVLFQPAEYYNASGYTIYAKGGIGSVICAQLNGIVMESAATDGNFNMAATQLCFDQYKHHRVIPMTIYTDQSYHNIAHSEILADYAGPTEEVKVADEV